MNLLPSVAVAELAAHKCRYVVSARRMSPSEHRRLTERWRVETMAAGNLQAALDLILERVESAGPTLTTLAEADNLKEWGDAMVACTEIEAANLNQGWRIAWTQKAEDGIGRNLRKAVGVSDAEATDAYWFSAARFSESMALSPDYPDPTPVDQVNIGWLLATGTADDAIDTLVVIHMVAMVDLAQKSDS